tara:strand:+ start:1590 stop:1766 length:177 start_codon:yes stop_codon:yes gene_type:complete
MQYKKRGIVTINNNGILIQAEIRESGIDSKNMVRVRPHGFHLDVSVSLDKNSDIFIIN